MSFGRDPEPLHPDRWGDFYDDRWQMRDTNPKAGEDEVWRPLRCPVCFKPLAARDACAACGDADEMEAA